MRRISYFLSLGFAHRTSKFRSNAFRFYCAQPINPPPPSKRPGPLAHYRTLVNQGKLQHDPYQENIAFELENLLKKLEQYEKDMEEYHVRLSKWEENRENERRRLLMEEAEVKQEGVFSSVKKNRSRIVENLISWGKGEKIEPGVGKWVSYLNRERKLDSLSGCRPTPPAAPKGLYLYGDVGSGKTMLMDMFYSATEGIVKHRRRFHFHEAMLEINEHMHKIWKKQVEEKSLQSSIASWIMNLPVDSKVKKWVAAEERYKQEVQMKNILPAVADKFLVDCRRDQRGASVLCFDEIQTVDVFAIVALSGILSRLLSTGTVLVATSNRAPRDLNQDGMQREIFLKLLAKLEEHCKNVLIGSEIDYRRLIAQRSIDQVHYFWPLDNIAVENLENMWNKITTKSGGRVTSDTIRVMFGRTLDVPECCNGIARFTFEYLCGRPVGAADYIAVAKNYHTVFISEVPMMSMRIRDKGTEDGTLYDLETFQFETETEGAKLRRDVLAEGNVSSGGTPTGIVSMLSGQEEMFALRRAVSRLIEMQTPFYLEGVHYLHPYFQARRHNDSFDVVGFTSHYISTFLLSLLGLGVVLVGWHSIATNSKRVGMSNSIEFFLIKFNIP